MLERSKLRTQWMVALLTISALGACSKDNAVDATQSTTPGVGQQCSGEGDPACGTTGVCVLGYCRIGCATDGECPQGTLCIGDTPPFGCQLQQDIHCSTSQPCEAPLLCGLDNTCRIGCGLTDPCPRNDQICIEGSCFGKLETNASIWSCDGSSQGDYRCDGTTLQVCNVGGLGWVQLEQCETAALCTKGKATGSCVDPVCSTSEDRCEGSLMKICNADRTEVVGTVCDSAALCTAGLPSKTCKQKVCSTGDLKCSGKNLQTCNAEFDGWDTVDTCHTDALCSDSVTASTGGCVAPACNPGNKRCTDANLEACNVGQTGWTVETPCATPELCTIGLALNGYCGEPACAVGAKQCSDYDVLVCNAGRTGFDVQETCPNICENGACTGNCHPDTQQCAGNVLQTCQCDGQWSLGIACPYVCKNNYCTGSCQPNAATCDGTKLRSCGSDGLWDAGVECEFACVSSKCTGVCKPGATQCGGGKVLYSCQSNGEWDPGQVCEFSCFNGACTAECLPGATSPVIPTYVIGVVQVPGLDTIAAAGGTTSACIAIAGDPTSISACLKAALANAQAEVGGMIVDLHIMLDQSGSMGWDTPTRWSVAKSGISLFMNSPEALGAGAALELFPGSPECDILTYETPRVLMGVLPSNATAIQDALNATSPGGGTPTAPALQGAINYARDRETTDPSRHVVVVLVTDGEPNNCSSTTPSVSAIAQEGVAPLCPLDGT